MHEYMTRHMVALRTFTYAQQELEPGDPFRATPDDRQYLIRVGRARDSSAADASNEAGLQHVAVPTAPQLAPSAPAAPEPTAPVVEMTTRDMVPAAAAAADQPGADDAAHEQGADAPTAAAPEATGVPTSRRRGRPTNAERAQRAAAEAAEAGDLAARS